MGQGIYDGEANSPVISLAFSKKRGDAVLPCCRAETVCCIPGSDRAPCRNGRVQRNHSMLLTKMATRCTKEIPRIEEFYKPVTFVKRPVLLLCDDEQQQASYH